MNSPVPGSPIDGISIDVVLPFYGDVEMLKAAVTSVLRQPDPDMRLTVVDDGYPDPQVAEWFASLEDRRATYHRNEVNLGANRNYRRAISMARGSHVVVMGADDIMHPNYTEVVRSTLARYPEAAIIQPGVDVIDGAGAPCHPVADVVKRLIKPSALSLDGEKLARSLLRGNWTYFPSLCWKLETLAAVGFRHDYHVAQDLALLLDLCFQGESLASAPDVAFSYRRHSASDSSSKAKNGYKFTEELRLYQEAEVACRSLGWDRAARTARLHVLSRLEALLTVRRAARAGDAAGVRALFRHAIMWGPSERRPRFWQAARRIGALPPK